METQVVSKKSKKILGLDSNIFFTGLTSFLTDTVKYKQDMILRKNFIKIFLFSIMYNIVIMLI